MTGRWRSVTIGDVCQLINGGTPKTKVAEFWDGPHAWITPAEMGGRASPYINDSRRSLSDDGLAKCSASLLPSRSVILSSRAPIGHLVINEVPMATNQGCKGLVPSDELDHKFLYYYLFSIVALLNDLGSGTTFKELSATKLRGVPIPLPPLPEQERIVAILDEAFAAIATATANAEKNLANARELFESRRNGLLERTDNDWAEANLGRLVTIKHGFAFKSEGFVEASDHVLLTPGSFFEEGGYRDRGTKQKYYAGEIPGEFVLSKGDLLVAMTEQAAGLLGSPLIVPESDRFLHNQRLGLIQPLSDTPWCSEFFFHVFNTRSFRMRVHADASGVKVRHTSPKKMYGVEVRYPQSTVEQQAVASLLNDMHDRCKILGSGYEQKAETLRELKQSILHKAFTGELTADNKATDRTLSEAGL